MTLKFTNLSSDYGGTASTAMQPAGSNTVASNIVRTENVNYENNLFDVAYSHPQA